MSCLVVACLDLHNLQKCNASWVGNLTFNFREFLCQQGWGCGYRTLQTICSWLQCQGKNGELVPVPSLLKIQEQLVAMGDKPSSFASSRNWIGSVEVGLIVDSLYDVSHIWQICSCHGKVINCFWVMVSCKRGLWTLSLGVTVTCRYHARLCMLGVGRTCTSMQISWKNTSGRLDHQ